MSFAALRKASLAILLFFLGGHTVGQEKERIWLGQLAPGDRLEIRTAEHVLWLQLIDPQTGLTQMQLSKDGVHFGPAEQVYLLGATAGRHPEGLMVVRMGCIEIGKRLELAVGDDQPQNRRLTSPVRQVQIYRSNLLALP
ncbi:MAG: hypothetical protein NZ602_07260 [Thermoguttaceae bacterium]|nr:hypothetical protein [Thermoguttaceae bacterium]MDW8038725.1 hypothetical protein [Thermoguttaceae bacterium]